MSTGLTRSSSLRGSSIQASHPDDRVLDTAVQQLCNFYLPDKNGDGGSDLRRRTSDEQFAQILAGYYEDPQEEFQRRSLVANPVQTFGHEIEFIRSHAEITAKKDTTITRRAPQPQHDPRFALNNDVTLLKDQHFLRAQMSSQYEQYMRYPYSQDHTYHYSEQILQSPSVTPPQPPRPSALSPRPPVEYTKLHPIDQTYNREYHYSHTPIIPRTEPQTRRVPRPPVTGISPIRPHKFPKDLPSEDNISRVSPPASLGHQNTPDTWKFSSWPRDIGNPRPKSHERRVQFNEIVTVIPAPENHMPMSMGDKISNKSLPDLGTNYFKRDSLDSNLIDGMTPMNPKDAAMGVKYGFLAEDRIKCDVDTDRDNPNDGAVGDKMDGLHVVADMLTDLDLVDPQSSAIFNAGLRGLNRSQSLSASYRHRQSLDEDTFVPSARNEIDPTLQDYNHDSNFAIDNSEVGAKSKKIGKSLRKIGRWLS